MSLFITTRRANHGLDNSPVDTAIVNLAARAALTRHEKHFPDRPNLEIVFRYPDPHDSKPFEGIFLKSTEEDEQVLHFEAAVPEHIEKSTQALEYIQGVLTDILVNTKDYFAKRNERFDEERWANALRQIAGW